MEVLYEIVSLAETFESTPFRALFAAYDEILPQHGIRPEHDRVYFRFLLRMGGNGDGTESLLERFETLLGRLGIQINFDAEEAEAFINHNAPPKNETHSLDDGGHPRLSRRASLESAYEPTPVQTRARFLLQATSPSRSRSQEPARKPHLEESAGIQSAAPDAQKSSRLRNINDRNQSSRHKVSLSQTAQTGVARRDRGEEPKFPPRVTSTQLAHDADISEDENKLGVQRQSAQERHQRSAQELSEMRTYAEAFRIRKIIAITRTFLHNTHDQVIVFGNMYKLAENYDARTLRNQAFEQWRVRFLNKRSLAETERFFAELDSRAQKARDLFLLTKAFTHWAYCASEELERKSAARLDVLQARCFTVWKEITVVNNLKARRLGLKKSFDIWKFRAAQALDHDRKARNFLAERLLLRFYRQWFWHFCGRRAPLWHDSKLRHKVFECWLARCQARTLDEGRATTLYDLQLMRKLLASWSDSTKNMQISYGRAIEFRNRLLAVPVLQSFERGATLLTLQRQAQQLVATRIVRGALQRWIVAARAVSVADDVCKSRIIRTAWTAWNDRLRCQALSRMIDDRLLMRSLYQWLLTERLQLCTRVRTERLQCSVFDLWRQHTKRLCSSLGKAKCLVDQRRIVRIKQATLQHWASQLQAQKESTTLADQYRHSQLRVLTFRVWHAKYLSVQRMGRQADDARYYVLATRTFGEWQDAIAARRRHKRREAYAFIRRKTKIALARRILYDWKNATVRLLDLHGRAEEMDDYRGLQTQAHVISTWYGKSQSASQALRASQDMNVRRLLEGVFLLLQMRSEKLRAIELSADEYLAQISDAAAVRVFRDMNWRLFQIKRQHETAESLEERNRRKHYRNMLRYWSERSAQTRNPQMLEKRGIHADADRHKEEALISFESTPGIDMLETGVDDSILGVKHDRVSALQTPGYLRTPSRRTVKTRTRSTVPTTPATPRSTPFMNRLRNMQTPAIRIRSARQDFTRSLMDERRPFDRIQETSPSESDALLD